MADTQDEQEQVVVGKGQGSMCPKPPQSESTTEGRGQRHEALQDMTRRAGEACRRAGLPPAARGERVGLSQVRGRSGCRLRTHHPAVLHTPDLGVKQSEAEGTGPRR